VQSLQEKMASSVRPRMLLQVVLLAIHMHPLHGFVATRFSALPGCCSRIGISITRVQAMPRRRKPTTTKKRPPAFRVALFHKPFGVLSDAYDTIPGDKWRGFSAFFNDRDSHLQPAGRLDANR
jgi:hypothetical protein